MRLLREPWQSGEISFGCYYGVVATTPLFVSLAGAHAQCAAIRWSRDGAHFSKKKGAEPRLTPRAFQSSTTPMGSGAGPTIDYFWFMREP